MIISKNMSSGQRKKVHAIIHGASASAAAVGGGLANIPTSDAPVLIAIQSGMIISIGKVFGKSVDESVAKTVISNFFGASIGKAVANVLTGWIPGIGNGINAATAASITEIIGWTAANEFADDDEKISEETAEILKNVFAGMEGSNTRSSKKAPYKENPNYEANRKNMNMHSNYKAKNKWPKWKKK